MAIKRSISRSVPVYVVWLPPAVLGAVLNWSPWLVLVLLVPGLVWYVASQGLKCYEDVRTANPEAPLGRRVPALYASPLFVVAIAFPTRFTGVLIVAGFVFVDLAWWWGIRTRRAIGEAGESAR